jgi:hypothetical protein
MSHWDDPEEWEDEGLAEDVWIPWLRSLRAQPDPSDPSGLRFLIAVSLEDAIETFPRQFVGTGGETFELVATDGVGLFWAEDWLSGCIPKCADYGTSETAESVYVAEQKALQRLTREFDEPDVVLMQGAGGERSGASRLIVVQWF